MKRLWILLIGAALICQPVLSSEPSWIEENWDEDDSQNNPISFDIQEEDFSFSGITEEIWEETKEAKDTQGVSDSFDILGESLLVSGMEEDFGSEELMSAEEMDILADAGSDPGKMNEIYMEPEKTITITDSSYGFYSFSVKDLEPSANDIYVISVFSDIPTIGTLYQVEKDSDGEVLSRSFRYSVDANKVDVVDGRTILDTNYHIPCDLSGSSDYAFMVEKADSGAASSADVFFSIKPLQEGVVIEQRRLTKDLVWSASCLTPNLPDNLLRIRLEIEGSGDIPGFHLQGDVAPWAGLSSHIEEVALHEVTGVGENAFAYLPRLMTVYLPSTLKSLGLNAFYSAQIREVMYSGMIGKLANMCPLNGGNLIDGLYRVFNPTSPWGQEVFAYMYAEPTQVKTLYNENTELGKVMYFDFMLEDYGMNPGEYVITFRANGHVEGSIQWRDTSDPGQEAPHYPIIKSVNNLDHEVTDEEVLALVVSLEKGRKYRIMLNACFAQSIGTKSITAYYSFTPKSGHNLVVEDTNITLTSKTKKQTIDLQATAKGEITYKSDNAKVKVSKSGIITIPKNFVGEAVITVTAGEAPGYEKESKDVTLVVLPASVKLSKVTSTKAKQMKISWSKSTNASGYVISYATKSSFANEKTVMVSSSKASTTIKKLTSKKKYYVRIRTYKKVDGVSYYSGWSKVLKVKVK